MKKKTIIIVLAFIVCLIAARFIWMKVEMNNLGHLKGNSTTVKDTRK